MEATKKKLLGQVDFNKVARYKVDMQKSIAYFYTSSEQLEF